MLLAAPFFASFSLTAALPETPVLLSRGTKSIAFLLPADGLQMKAPFPCHRIIFPKHPLHIIPVNEFQTSQFIIVTCSQLKVYILFHTTRNLSLLF
jgi:hypothetical protein